jgi:hypothetical protein
MYNPNTPLRPQIRPMSSAGSANMGYAPSPIPNGTYPPMHASTMTPQVGQKRKLDGDATAHSHIPVGPGATSSSTSAAAPGPGQPERKFRPPMPPPHLLASLVPESRMFKQLIEMEQKLDWTMLRKRAEVNDSLGRVVKVGPRAISHGKIRVEVDLGDDLDQENFKGIPIEYST